MLTPLAALALRRIAVPVRNRVAVPAWKQVAVLVLAWERPAVLVSWVGW